MSSKTKTKAPIVPPVKVEDGKWRNRIVGHAMVAGSTLLANPRNYRLHPENQQQALSGVLDQVGWVQSCIVNQRSGFVVDGHMRAALAISRGESVPVTYVDLSDEEEALILAALDTISTVAVTDAEKFGSLFHSLSNESSALDALLSSFLGDAEKTSLQTEAEGGGSSNASPGRGLGEHKDETVKAVISTSDLSTFERALKATGERNRGKAVIAICKAYLERPERQHDLSAEMPFAAFNPAAD